MSILARYIRLYAVKRLLLFAVISGIFVVFLPIKESLLRVMHTPVILDDVTLQNDDVMMRFDGRAVYFSRGAWDLKPVMVDSSGALENETMVESRNNTDSDSRSDSRSDLNFDPDTQLQADYYEVIRAFNAISQMPAIDAPTPLNIWVKLTSAEYQDFLSDKPIQVVPHVLSSDREMRGVNTLFLTDIDLQVLQSLQTAQDPALPDKVLTLLVGKTQDNTQGLSILMLVLMLFPLIIALYFLWLLLNPYALSDLRAIQRLYKITPILIDQFLREAKTNHTLIARRGVVLTPRVMMIAGLMKFRIVVVSELEALSAKKGYQITAVLWWLRKHFLYVTEMRRAFKARISPKMLPLIFKMIDESPYQITLETRLKMPVNKAKNDKKTAEHAAQDHIVVADDYRRSKQKNPEDRERETILENRAIEPAFLAQTAGMIQSRTRASENHEVISAFMREGGKALLGMSVIWLLSLGVGIILPLIGVALYVVCSVIWSLWRMIMTIKIMVRLKRGSATLLGVITLFLLMMVPLWIYQVSIWLLAAWAQGA